MSLKKIKPFIIHLELKNVKFTFKIINTNRIIMKTRVLNSLAVIAIGLTILGCKGDAKESVTSAAEAVTNEVAETKYKAIASESMIHWKANKLVGGHEGTIHLEKGIVKSKANALVGGNFIFDISSLKNTDMPVTDEGNAKLVGHLLSPDFFDVKKHPNAAFEITKVEGNNVSGNLTIKGIKKNITFPANVSVNGDVLTISSDAFIIDRTEWGIKYNSGKFADPAKLGDYLIKDDIELKIMLKANKA